MLLAACGIFDKDLPPPPKKRCELLHKRAIFTAGTGVAAFRPKRRHRGLVPVLAAHYLTRGSPSFAAGAEMRIRLAIAFLTVPGIALAQQPPAKITLYKTADSAACWGDTAVWVDLATGLYHVKPDKSFAKTKRGGYTCRRQADAAGYRPSRQR